jgi:hypothetical protein
MPDDTQNLAEQMRDRGALPVTIRAPLDGERTVRAAAWRLPASHSDMPLIDQLHEAGWFNPAPAEPITHATIYAARAEGMRLYANACAVARLYHIAGLGRSKGVAAFVRQDLSATSGEERTTLDELHDAMRRYGEGFSVVLDVVRGQRVSAARWRVALQTLALLDELVERWDGEMWADENA